jgi:hypothetical protein
MPLREADEFYGMPRGQVPNYVNGYAVQSLAHSLPFDVRGAADVIEVPVLIVHSERALAPDLAHAFYSAVKRPNTSFGSSRRARSTSMTTRASSPRPPMP